MIYSSESREALTMAFEEALEDLATKVAAYTSTLATEEATKTAVVMPFISVVLG